MSQHLLKCHNVVTETEDITILDDGEEPLAKKSKSENGKETNTDDSMDSNLDEVSILNDSGEGSSAGNESTRSKPINPRLSGSVLPSIKTAQPQRARPGPASRTAKASSTCKSSQSETSLTIKSSGAGLANKPVELGSTKKLAGSGSFTGDLEDSRFECEECWFTSDTKLQLDVHNRTKHGKASICTTGVTPVEPKLL